jgi:glucose-1-phosphate adenylyltransferase
MVNANISNINIVANYNYRSLTEHIGSGKDWDLARRESGINFISPFQTAYNASGKMFATHMEALKSMKREYIDKFKEEYVVLIDSDQVLNIDVADVIKTHEKTDASVTFVTVDVDKNYTAKHPQMMLSSVAGKVTQIAMSSAYDERHPEHSVGMYVMKTTYLRSIIDEAEAFSLNSLSQFFLKNCKSANYRTYKYSGFVASVSSFLDYYKCTMDLVKDPEARASLLGKRDFPVYTRVHNSSPSVYKSTAKVVNSMIADECVIEGTVINSVLFRGVHVAKGAVVKDSVLFSGTYVDEGASVNCVLTDKDVHVTEGVNLSGNHNMPFYVQKGRKV